MDELLTTAKTLAIAVVAMIAALWLGLPAAFITGPALVLAILSIATPFKFGVMPQVREAGFLILGVAIGTAASPELIANAVTWPLSMFALVAAIVFMMIVGTWMMERWFDFSRRDAMLAATPGHLTFVMAIAEGSPDAARITLAHSVRLLSLALLIPFVLKFMGLMPAGTGLPDEATMPWPMLLAMIAVCGGVGLVLGRFKIPAAMLIAGMAGAMLANGAGITQGRPPTWLYMAGFTMLGAIMGARFSACGFAELKRAFWAGVAMTLLPILTMLLVIVLLHPIIDASWVTLLIAFAPGAIETMAALAIILKADAMFVAAHHLARMVVLPFLVPLGLTIVWQSHR